MPCGVCVLACVCVYVCYYASVCARVCVCACVLVVPSSPSELMGDTTINWCVFLCAWERERKCERDGE